MHYQNKYKPTATNTQSQKEWDVCMCLMSSLYITVINSIGMEENADKVYLQANVRL
jgi:hypothetical protein